MKSFPQINFHYQPPVPLDSKYGYISCDNKTYKQISLIDVESCEELGQLSKKYGNLPDICKFDNKLYLQVVKNIVGDYLKLTKETGELVDYNSFSEEKLQEINWDFTSTLRLFAYTNGSFNHVKSLSVLNNSNFFMSREEFFKCLTQYNIPYNIALDIVKKVFGPQEKGVKNILKFLIFMVFLNI